MKVKINMKKFSRKQNRISQIEYDYPGEIRTVKELLEETVKIGISSYKERMERGELLQVLSGEEIEDQAQSGKISFGVNYGIHSPKLEESMQNALQSFEDGILVLFVGDRQMERLEEPVVLGADTELTFIRMTPLAGRMW